MKNCVYLAACSLVLLVSISLAADQEFCLACEPFVNDVVKYKDEKADKFVDKTRKACAKRFDMVYPTFCKTLVTAQIDDIQTKLQGGQPVKKICQKLKMC
ncbi:unnamed protein product, partial [Mesorhabditis spiculigera]